jgi:hypothetical protein
VSVTIINTGDTELTGVEVQPVALVGRLLSSEVEVKEAEESELEARRRAVIEEMESQVAIAYERQQYKVLSFGDAIALSVVRAVDGYASLFAGQRVSRVTPKWTHEAFRIHEWEDVEMLEKEIIALESEDSRVKRAFLIDKQKLERCLDSLGKRTAAPSTFQAGASLAPGGSITFPFAAKTPHLLRRRTADLQLRITYRDMSTAKLTSESLSRRVAILPSAFSVPTGSMIGAACGYAIKIALQSKAGAPLPLDWGALGGSVLLGLLVALLTSRRPETHKVITVEDFLGGFIVGALTGMFSEGMFDRLRVLAIGTKA